MQTASTDFIAGIKHAISLRVLSLFPPKLSSLNCESRGFIVSIGDVRPQLLLVDDHAGMLEKIKNILDPRFDLVGALSDSRLAISAVEQLSPDLIVLDICMPGLDGFCVARILRQNKSSVKILFLTVQDDEDYIAAALAVGAQGYVLKSRMHIDLVQAVDCVLAGKTFISPRRRRPPR